MLCRLIGHKYERKTQNGGIESSEYLLDGIVSPKETIRVKVKYCYRCQKYITPPLNIRILINLFGDKNA